MAHKKKNQPAQEVQKDMAFFVLQAEYLMKKAIKHYNKPQSEIVLNDAFNMLNEDSVTDKEKATLNDNIEDIEQAAETLTGKDKDSITLADLQTATAEFLTGKDKEETTLADLQTAIKEHLPEEKTLMPSFLPSDEELEKLTAAIAQAASVGETVNALKEAVTAITQSIDFKAIAEGIKDTLSFLSDMALNADQIAEVSGRALDFEREILPYIMLEIADRTGYKYALQLSFEDVLRIMQGEATPEEYNEDFENAFSEACQQFALDGTPTSQYGHELLEAAAKRKVALINDGQTIGALVKFAEVIAETAPDIEQAELIKKELPELKQLPQIIAKQIDNVNYPLDKPNSKIWNLLSEADTNGQIRIDFDTSKKGSGKEALVSYSIDFNALENLPELKITRKLTPFDKRVYIIAAALFNAGNEVVTATQIYKADHDKEPNDKDIEKINDSLTKMGAAHIFIDNNKEVNSYKKYPQFKYDASLLPFERMSAYINGKLSEAAIHLLREPPLITFAKERKQITTIDRKILLAPVSNTNANLSIADYLIERISHMKRPRSKAPRKLLYSTIYENCGIIEKKQKQRAPEKIKRFLDHYVATNFIKGYTTSAEGVTIVL